MSERSNEDSWIEWDGGDCPVDRFAKVQVNLRSGHTNEREAAYFEWVHGRGAFGYEHDDDVISYRMVTA